MNEERLEWKKNLPEQLFWDLVAADIAGRQTRSWTLRDSMIKVTMELGDGIVQLVEGITHIDKAPDEPHPTLGMDHPLKRQRRVTVKYGSESILRASIHNIPDPKQR